MGIIPDSLTTKDKGKSGSFYHYLIARYISPIFAVTFKQINIQNPNIVTLISFLFIILSSVMVINIKMLGNIYYRITIAVIIQLSFILDASDGQLARITGKSTKLGAWLDRLLDRAGEFLVFLCFGIVAWKQYGPIFFIHLGLITGYGHSIFTMAMTLKESSFLENRELITKIKKDDKARKKKTHPSKKPFNKTRLAKILSNIFFFLNFGVGERYLYLSFFIILNRVDIMLYISSFLTSLRFLSMTVYCGKNIKKWDYKLNNTVRDNNRKNA